MPAQTMREQLEDAFNDEQEESEETGGSSEDTKEPLGDTGETDPSSKEESDESGDDSVVEPSSVKAAVEKVETPEKEEEKEELDTPESEPDLKGKAPSSWKPAAREDWGKIPEGAQREIARREKHMDNMMRESADSRKHHSDFTELMRPFESLIAAQNSTPFQAVKNLMSTAAGLTLGSPQQKAQVVSNIMKEYGVDVAELDNVLVGQPGGKQGDPGMQQMIQQELAPIRKFMGDMNTQQQNYQENQQYTINTEIDTFAKDPRNEFFEDVREDMADLMEMSSNRGEAMNIQEAYDRACRIDPSIFNIISKRAAANTAAENNKQIVGKRRAASSIHGEAVGSETGQGSATIRGAITDAWDDAS